MYVCVFLKSVRDLVLKIVDATVFKRLSISSLDIFQMNHQGLWYIDYVWLGFTVRVIYEVHKFRVSKNC